MTTLICNECLHFERKYGKLGLPTSIKICTSRRLGIGQLVLGNPHKKKKFHVQLHCTNNKESNDCKSARDAGDDTAKTKINVRKISEGLRPEPLTTSHLSTWPLDGGENFFFGHRKICIGEKFTFNVYFKIKKVWAIFPNSLYPGALLVTPLLGGATHHLNKGQICDCSSCFLCYFWKNW